MKLLLLTLLLITTFSCGHTTRVYTHERDLCPYEYNDTKYLPFKH